MATDKRDLGTDHGDLGVLRVEDCEELLRRHQIGRVAFLNEGEPVILPVNYLYREGRVVFRSAPGAKLEAAEHARAVAFGIDGWEEAERSGWSVLVRGVAEHVVDRATLEELEGLGLRPWAPAAEGGMGHHPPLRDLGSAGGLKPERRIERLPGGQVALEEPTPLLGPRARSMRACGGGVLGSPNSNEFSQISCGASVARSSSWVR